jgi:hypothetical protein
MWTGSCVYLIAVFQLLEEGLTHNRAQKTFRDPVEKQTIEQEGCLGSAGRFEGQRCSQARGRQAAFLTPWVRGSARPPCPGSCGPTHMEPGHLSVHNEHRAYQNQLSRLQLQGDLFLEGPACE